MKKTINKLKTTHGLFWELLRKQVNFHPDYQEDLKANIVMEYSGGKTSSLTMMYNKYPAAYFNMIAALKERAGYTPQARRFYDPESNTWRKRVIKVIGIQIDRLNVEPSEKMEYIKAIACRQAPCRDFNKIPVSRLAEIYNYWLKRNEVAGNAIIAEAVLLNLEAEAYLQTIKQIHFNNSKHYENK